MSTAHKSDLQNPVDPPAMAPTQIRELRQSVKMSQPVFAYQLGLSRSTVAKWERGTRRPSVMALRLLNVVQKHGLDIIA